MASNKAPVFLALLWLLVVETSSGLADIVLPNEIIQVGNTVYGYNVSVATDAGEVGPGVILLNRTEDIEVQAFNLQVLGTLTAKELSVVVLAENVQCSSAVCIDVSGYDGYSPPGQAPSGNSTDTNGEDGVTGTDGGNGGNLTFMAGSVYPSGVLLNAGGGNGGLGQVGGDGYPGQPGGPQIPSSCILTQSSSSQCVGQWQPNVCKGACNDYEFSGLKGLQGGSGGNAGANGANGNGGYGGQLFLWIGNAASTVSSWSAGGARGNQTIQGQAGAGGKGGPGGCASSEVWTNIPAKSCSPVWSCKSCGTGACAGRGPCKKAQAGAAGSDGIAGSIPNVPAFGSEGVAGNTLLTSLSSEIFAPDFGRLLLRKARRAYLELNSADAQELLSFIHDLASNCSQTSTTCMELLDQTTTLMYRLGLKLEFYGSPHNWVSTLSLGSIKAFIVKNLLGGLKALQVAEQSYVTVWSGSASTQDQVTAVQNSIASLQSQLSNVQANQQALQSQLAAVVGNITTVLAPAVQQYQAQLMSSASNFKTAIAKVHASSQLWLVFQSLSDASLFIGGAIACSKEVATSLVETYDSLTSVVVALSSHAPVPVNVVGVLSDTSPAGAAAAWSQIRGLLTSPEDKFLVEESALLQLLEQYRILAAGIQYQLAITSYIAAAQNLNDETIKSSYLWTTYLQNEQDATAFNASIATVLAELSTNTVSPTALNLVADAYQLMQEQTLYYLYQENAGLRYLNLTNTAFTYEDTSYASLAALHQSLSSSLLRSLAVVPKKVQFPPVLLNRVTVPGFSQMLASGNVNFVLTPCTAAFTGNSKVLVTQVSIAAVGATALLPKGTRSPLPMTLTNLGRVELLDPYANLSAFTHSARSALHSYDVSTGAVITQGTFSNNVGPVSKSDPFGPAYTSISPFGLWVLNIPPSAINSAVSTANVNTITVQFSGTIRSLTSQGFKVLPSLCPAVAACLKLPQLPGCVWPTSCTTSTSGSECVGTCSKGFIGAPVAACLAGSWTIIANPCIPAGHPPPPPRKH